MLDMDTERIEALGERGEACIIIARRDRLPNGQAVATYSLATGERLKPADEPDVFQTLDGNRTFRLRK